MIALLLAVAAAEEVTQEDLLEKKGGLWQVERSVNIEAPASTVEHYLSDLSTWSSWTAWNDERDPECTWDFDGEAGTVGHSMHWQGPEMGEGWLTLTQVEEGEIRYDLWFRKKKGTSSKGRLVLTETDGTTEVSWSNVGTMGLVGRLFIGAIEEGVSADFDQGLQGVKVAAEADHTAWLEAEEARKAAEEAEREAAEEAERLAEEEQEDETEASE